MLTYAGEDLNDIFDTLSTDLVTPQPGTDETVFSKAVEALDVYFNPKQNKEFQSYVFRHTNQERFESVKTKSRERDLSEPDLSIDKLLQFAKTKH